MRALRSTIARFPRKRRPEMMEKVRAKMLVYVAVVMQARTMRGLWMQQKGPTPSALASLRSRKGPQLVIACDCVKCCRACRVPR
jgi:hypothetical protein